MEGIRGGVRGEAVETLKVRLGDLDLGAPAGPGGLIP